MTEQFEPPVMPNCGVVTSPIAQRHEIMLDDYIAPPSAYREEFMALQDATENDIVDIYINTPGGCLATAVQFMNAINSCNAHVTTHLTGEAYSAGSMIFLQGHSFIVNPMTSLMAHNSSGGYAGKASDVVGHAVHYKDWMNQLMGEVYKHFLTPDEVELLLNGKEFWMLDHDIIRRLEMRNQILEQLAKENQEPDVDKLVTEEELDDVIQHISTTPNYAKGRVQEFYNDIEGMKFQDARHDCLLLTGYNPKSWKELYQVVEEYYGV